MPQYLISLWNSFFQFTCYSCRILVIKFDLLSEVTRCEIWHIFLNPMNNLAAVYFSNYGQISQFFKHALGPVGQSKLFFIVIYAVGTLRHVCPGEARSKIKTPSRGGIHPQTYYGNVGRSASCCLDFFAITASEILHKVSYNLVGSVALVLNIVLTLHIRGFVVFCY